MNVKTVIRALVALLISIVGFNVATALPTWAHDVVANSATFTPACKADKTGYEAHVGFSTIKFTDGEHIVALGPVAYGANHIDEFTVSKDGSYTFKKVFTPEVLPNGTYHVYNVNLGEDPNRMNKQSDLQVQWPTAPCKAPDHTDVNFTAAIVCKATNGVAQYTLGVVQLDGPTATFNPANGTVLSSGNSVKVTATWTDPNYGIQTKVIDAAATSDCTPPTPKTHISSACINGTIVSVEIKAGEQELVDDGGWCGPKTA